jgi:plastocyanin
MRVLACAGLLLSAIAASAQPAAWVTLKGQVVLPAAVPVPKRAPLVVNQDGAHCLRDGPILDEKFVVNEKSRGIANVVVWLRPDQMNPKAAFAANEIHPALASRKPADVVIDQPCCAFVPRVLAARVGDTVVVKNPAPVNHNFFWTSENKGELNVNLAPKQEHRFAKPLAAEPSPIQYKCTIHPWMNGYVRIFDHPYYAVTDPDGSFTIRDAPAGNYRLVYWHENPGFKGKAAGRFGDPVVIAGPGPMELKPTEFDVTR